MISLIHLKETHVFAFYASSTLFICAEGTRQNNKVADLYLRDCFLEGNYRVLSGVRSFSKIMFLPLLWLLPRTLKWPKAWTHVPAKAWPGTVMRKCIHFWIRWFSEVSIFRVLVNRSNKCVKKKSWCRAKSSIFRVSFLVKNGRFFTKFFGSSRDFIVLKRWPVSSPNSWKIHGSTRNAF